MKKPDPSHASFLPDFCNSRIVFGVIIMAQLLAIVLTLAQPAYVNNRLYDLALFSFYAQWIALCCAGGLCLCRPYINHLPDHWVATWSYAITLLISLALIEAGWWIFRMWPAGEGYFRFGHGLYLLRAMGISAIASALTLRYFYVQHQWRRQIKSEAEARFQALQSRIRPHFLFNSMNTIASLTRRQPARAEEAIEDLSDLFRATLNDARNASSLEDEFDLCRRYLRIEQHRLGERLAVQWQVDSLPLEARLPQLTLQPLLENAIYHGIEQLPEGGTIRIFGEQQSKTIEISITNPVAGSLIGNQNGGNKMAQENIEQRLNAMFHRSGLMRTTPEQDSYRVTITIPYPHEDTDSR